MKHIEIINAYKALDSLASQRLPLPVSYKLFKLRGEMQKIYDFRLEEEQKLFDQFKPTMEEDNRLRFATTEDREQFDERIAALNDMEDDTIQPIDIPLLDTIELTTDEIQSLSSIIRFAEPEK